MTAVTIDQPGTGTADFMDTMESHKRSDFLVELARSKPRDSVARMVYEWVVDLNPQNAEALAGLGLCAMSEKKWTKAIAKFSLAELKGCDTAALHINLGTCLAAVGAYVEAEDSYSKANMIDPANVHAYLGMFSLGQMRGDNAQSEAAIAQGLQAIPNDPQLLFCLATLQLARGDYENGWKNYEYRPTHLQLQALMDEREEWDGSPLNGRRLLVCREQGLGDEIMFARYQQWLTAYGENVVYYGYPALARLFDNPKMPKNQITFDLDIPDFDVWLGSASLSKLFGCIESDVFRNSYLSTSESDINRFAALIPRDGNLRIGLCWSGNPEHPKDSLRSLKFEDLAPILEVPGCTFYSIQQGVKVDDPRVIDAVRWVHDIADTAAIIANLDLVITIDSMPAHLCGAIGSQCLVMLGKCSDWRWGLDGVSNSWYSSVKCARGGSNGIKEAVLKAACELRIMADGHIVREPVSRPMQEPLVRTKACKYGDMSFYRNDHYVGRALDLYGEYSSGEADLFHALLRVGDTIIEAGANIGALTVELEDAVGPSGTVFAFEPAREYFSLLTANVHDLSHVQARDYALGDICGTIDFRAIDHSRVTAPGWKATGEEYSRKQITIDSLDLGACDFIKADTDGSEHRILIGAEQTIAHFRPILYVEWDKPEAYPDMLEWIAERDYRIYLHKPRLFNPNNFAGNKTNVFGNLVSQMLLCIPNERKDLRADTIPVPLDRVRLSKG